MAGAREDVLPAVGLQEVPGDKIRFRLLHCPAAIHGEVGRIRLGLHLQDRIDRHHQLDELADPPLALLRGERCVVALQLELVEDRVLGLILPVEQEHILEKFRELVVGLDALPVVELHEQLDVQREHEHRPGALGEHGAGNRVGIDVEAIAGRHRLAHHRFDAPEQGLMLDLLVAEPHQGLQRVLVAQCVMPAHIDELGRDKALDQAKDVGVSASLDLADKARLGL